MTNVVGYKTYQKLISETIAAISKLSARIGEETETARRNALIAQSDILKDRRQKLVAATQAYLTSDAPDGKTALAQLQKTVAQARRVNKRLNNLAKALDAATDFVSIVTRFVSLIP